MTVFSQYGSLYLDFCKHAKGALAREKHHAKRLVRKNTLTRGQPIRIHIKKFIIQLSVGVLRLLSYGVRAVGFFLLLVIVRPITIVADFIFRHILVRLYRVYRIVKVWMMKKLLPAKSTISFPFTRNTAIHIVVFLLGIIVLSNNVLAREVRAEDFGKRSLVNTFINNSLEQLTEDTSAAKAPIREPIQSAAAANKEPVVGEVAEAIEPTVITSQVSGAVVSSGLIEPDDQSPRSRVVYYYVEPGDTISTIAEKFHISGNTVLWENRLGSRDYIRPGDKLTILPASGLSHQVQSGDTVAKIAQKYSVSADEVIEYNRLADATAIEKGQILLIPGGTMPEAPKSTNTYTPSRYAYQNIPPPARVTSSGRLLWPTPSHRINQYFRYGHTGIDIDGDYSSPIYAASDGIVESVNNAGRGYGLNVIVNHGGNMKTLYAHASKIFVRAGQRVSRGQVLAMMGCTGWCTGTHVHFEVRINNRPVNPLSYL